NPQAVEFLYIQAREGVKCESTRAEIDARIQQLLEPHQKNSTELERSWSEREEKAWELGYEIDTRPSLEQQHKLKQAWKKREEENKEMNGQ
ncbi:MAG: hypothetical protein NWF06_05010, partial [Candidatus Bathyarchaeota archaeon]|nr:hypothetical protein [Candidatus Bathyarchaeum sp.]